MKPVEQILRALLAVLVDECKRNPDFAERIAASFGQEGNDARGVEARANRRPARRAPGPIDPFALFEKAGPEALAARLQGMHVEQLKDIIAEHSMDTSRLAMKWKVRDRLVQFIVEKVVSRTRKGGAFLGGDFKIMPGDAEYVQSWDAVLVPIELMNRGKPDTITSIHLRVADDSFGSGVPDSDRQISRLVGSVPRRFDTNDGITGVLYFGPTYEDGRRIPVVETGELIIQRASGAIQRNRVKIRARSAQ